MNRRNFIQTTVGAGICSTILGKESLSKENLGVKGNIPTIRLTEDCKIWTVEQVLIAEKGYNTEYYF